MSDGSFFLCMEEFNCTKRRRHAVVGLLVLSHCSSPWLLRRSLRGRRKLEDLPVMIFRRDTVNHGADFLPWCFSLSFCLWFSFDFLLVWLVPFFGFFSFSSLCCSVSSEDLFYFAKDVRVLLLEMREDVGASPDNDLMTLPLLFFLLFSGY